MTDLWVLCEHGEKGRHEIEWSYDPDNPECVGGHLATVEEVVEWLKESRQEQYLIRIVGPTKPDDRPTAFDLAMNELILKFHDLDNEAEDV